ncbi:hypothetical protein RclHR1_06750004 [Rhizophagus clarus]|uniref:Uncharacterized protein n=1 Tax=Rhizophagus clarus TaxID=94130 RepID=A0A2Z6S9T8_9GLOM|nr:hypothetical protein RclHR1_06750004 [Rhizophagus clarus]
MWARFIGASSIVAVFVTNTSKVSHPQERYHTKKEIQTSDYHPHYNNHPHYQFQYQFKPTYPAFSRYAQTVDISESSNFTKKHKSNGSKSSKRSINLTFLKQKVIRLTRKKRKKFSIIKYIFFVNVKEYRTFFDVRNNVRHPEHPEHRGCRLISTIL